MNKFSVDYKEIETLTDKKKYKLSDVKDSITKLAFDVVFFTNGDPNELWQIQSADDGDYIVALYDKSEDKKVEKTASLKSEWSVTVNKIGSDLNIFYKNEPIVKVSASSLGFDKADLAFTVKYLGEKLASNKILRDSLLLKVDQKFRNELYKKYPELG